jgi:hypothetical protein
MINALRDAMHGYTVKKMKSMPSRNGIAWSCDIYKGVIKVAEVYDAGNGGNVNVNYFNAVSKLEFIKISKITCPEFDFEQEGTFAAVIEDNSQAIKSLTRKCKTATLYQLAEDAGGEVYRSSKTPFTPKIAELIRAKYGANLHCIINEQI